MKRYWMPFYVGDYLADTRHLSTLEHGAYCLLMMHYWQRGGLPNDDQQLARIAGLDLAEWSNVKPTLQELFGPRWTHKRIDAEIAKSNQRSERGRNGGLASAEARRRTPRDRSGNRRNYKEIEPNSNDSSNQTPTKRQPNANPNVTRRLTFGTNGTPTERQAPQPQPQKVDDDGGGDARAREPLVSEHAVNIACELAEIAGHGRDPKSWPPGWCGAPMRVQAWLHEGWETENILAAARQAMARKRDGPPDTANYFEKPIARLRARNAAPLPRAIINDEQNLIVNGASHAPDRGFGFHKNRINRLYYGQDASPNPPPEQSPDHV